MIFKTHRISGAGNTFHITWVDPLLQESGRLHDEAMKKIANRACKKDPADGFIFLAENKNTESNNEYKWWFYNNDGSEAEMCGNATRCVGFYLKNIVQSPLEKWQLKTAAGIITIQFVQNEKYKITMTPIKEFKSEHGFYCDTGVPHLVIEKTQFTTDLNLKQAARELRQHHDFFPRGTNITYVAFENDDQKVKAVSYERGVEDFSAACGTGAVAAAFFNLTKRGVKQTQVEMPGGTLMMDLSDISRPEMTGPAVLSGSFEYEFSI